MRSVEIFSGAAGLGLGLSQAGFHHEVVIEHNRAACDTIRYNQARDHALVRGWRVLEADVESVDLSQIRAEPDLLAGGPPCQEFSAGGKHKGAAGERNMWPWTIQATRILRPRAFVFENVPGLASRHAEYLEYLKLALSAPELANPTVEDWMEDAAFLRQAIASGVASAPTYRVSVEKMVATDYGTAQKRSRIFVVGIRSDVTGEWRTPAQSHSHERLMDDKWINGSYWERHGLQRPEIDEAGVRYLRQHNQRGFDDLFATPLRAHRTVRDAIGDLPDPATGLTTNHADHEAAPREARVYKGHTGSPVDEPSKTLRAGVHGVSGGENLVDYGPDANEDRYRHFTVREAARLAGFPDDYHWPKDGPISTRWSQGLAQIGNCVPLEMAKAVGESVVTAIK